jgi:hypothetical protein
MDKAEGLRKIRKICDAQDIGERFTNVFPDVLSRGVVARRNAGRSSNVVFHSDDTNMNVAAIKRATTEYNEDLSRLRRAASIVGAVSEAVIKHGAATL